MISISKALNQEYANRDISMKSTLRKGQSSIKLSKIIWCGFPFKFAVQVIGLQEEDSFSKIEYNMPIYVGYDLLKQSFFISYSGEAIGHYKPLESEFGVRFKTNNHSFIIQMPLNLKLLRIFIEKKHWFEIVNFIKTLEFKSDKTQIFNLIDQQNLFDKDHTLISLSFDKSKYYVNLQDFLNNAPQRFDVYYSSKVLRSNLSNRIIPFSLLLSDLWYTALDRRGLLYDSTILEPLYNVDKPIAIEGKFYVKTNTLTLNKSAKDLEINIIYAKSSSHTHESLTSFLYKGKLDDVNHDIYFKIDSQAELKQGFINSTLDFIKNLILNLSTSYQYKPLIKELEYFINNEKFNFTELENNKYKLSLDCNVITRPHNIVKATINDFSIFSNDTGFRLTTECDFNPLRTLNIKGLIVLNNYQKIVELGGNYFYNLGKFQAFSDESRQLYIESAKQFLKSISDHPNSNAPDISFEYEFDLNNINKATIGTVNTNNLMSLYYLALYKEAFNKIRIGDNIITRMKELIPDFNNHQKLLEQLMIQPLQEIIK